MNDASVFPFERFYKINLLSVFPRISVIVDNDDCEMLLLIMCIKVLTAEVGGPKDPREISRPLYVLLLYVYMPELSKQHRKCWGKKTS